MGHTLINAEHYKQNSCLQKTLASEVLAYHQFASNDVVLDIGCGDGKITSDIANYIKDGSILGIDSSLEMVALAKKTFVNTLHNLDFQQTNAEDYHGSEIYTVITSFSCLHWIRDIKTTLINIYKALKPGGHFLALTYLAESQYYKPFINVFNLPKWKNNYKESIFNSMLDSQTLIQFLLNLGFIDIKTQLIESTAEYKNEKEYIDYVKGWLPCVLHVSSTKLNDYFNEVIFIAKQEFLKGTAIVIPYIRLDIYMQKPITSE